MSRGKDQFWPNGDISVNVGGDWICDACGDREAPNQGMYSPFSDGKHLCKSCLTEGVVEYFNYDYQPEIMLYGQKSYVIHCQEFEPGKRKPRVPVKLYREILSAGKCNYCGSKESLQIDHIIPSSKGGATQRENLQCLCRSCNCSKGDKIKHAHLKRLLPKGADNSQ